MCSAPLDQNGSSRRFSLWIIVLALLAILGAFGFYHSFTGTNALDEIAQDQLQALKEDKITKAYYHYTSKGFQNATSLTDFKEFLKQHPLLLKNEGHLFLDRSVDENDLGTLSGVIFSQSGEATPVEYKLIKESDEWKILSVTLGTPTDLAPEGSAELLKEIQPPIMDQLKALQEHEVKKAYEDYTSADFKQATPLNTFELFLKSYPILTNHTEASITHHSGSDERAIANVLLSNKEGAIPVEYRLVKEGGQWKIWSMRLILPPGDQTNTSDENVSELMQPILDQLKDLGQGDIKAAYSNVAKAFKSATSEEQFTTFINNFPVMKNNTPKMREHFVTDNTAKLRVDLENSEGIIPVEYTLIKEDGVWKILGIEVLNQPKPPKTADSSSEFDSTQLTNTIEAQLKALRSHDYTAAYEKYTAEAFKKSTSFDDFMAFVSNYPIFSDNAAFHLPRLMFDNNIGILNGTLTSGSGETRNVEYNMVKEDGMWKILSIKILSSNDSAQAVAPPSQIDKIDLGTTVDSSGVVQQASRTFAPESGEIYATLHISGAKAGEKVNIEIQHLSNGARLPAASALLDNNGTANVSFSFTPPKTGWPVGNYRLIAATTSGGQSQQTFSIQH